MCHGGTEPRSRVVSKGALRLSGSVSPWRSSCFPGLVLSWLATRVARFRNQPLVHVAGVIVRRPRLVAFVRSDGGRLLRPALVHGGEAPLGAAARCANRLVADEHEDQVRV